MKSILTILGETIRTNDAYIKAQSSIIIGNDNIIEGYGNSIRGDRNTLIGNDNSCFGKKNVVKEGINNLMFVILSTEDFETERLKSIKNSCKKPMELENNINTVNDLTKPNEEKEICVVCLDKKKTCIALPCGHYNFCTECTNELKKKKDTCPICRNIVKEYILVYE
jgi:hypothetical protein